MLGTSFDICSLVDEVDLEMLVNATDGRENVKAQFIIKHLLYTQYSIESRIFKNLSGAPEEVR